MPLYCKDDPNWFKYSLNSILAQTISPDEIVLIADGPLTEELDIVVNSYVKQYGALFNVIRFEKNIGLGRLLAKGIEICRNELIVRMDADDYALPNRCEKQLQVFTEQPDIDLVGSNVDEFIGSIDNVVSNVVLPQCNDEIITFAKKRCPVRHPTLMYKKQAVMKAGNYRDYRHAQDYNLIVHMILNGAKMYNIQDVLVYMRVSPDFYKRRGGWKQMKLVLKLKKEFYDYGFYSAKDFAISAIGNAIVCLMPNSVRVFIYKKLLR
jgi:glycosyltransferase involved in cell wall biosynthesis